MAERQFFDRTEPAAGLEHTQDRAVLLPGSQPEPRPVGPLARLRALVAMAYALELARGTPFAFAPVFLAAGAFAYFLAPDEPSLLLLGGGTVLVGGAAVALRGRAVAGIALAAMLCLLAGALLAKLETLRVGTKMLGSEISTRLTGQVEVVDHLASGRVRLTLRVLSTERPQLRYAPERVRVSARSIPPGLKAGDVAQGIVRLMPPPGPLFPGGYDFSFQSYFNGIGATGFFLGKVQALEGAAPRDPRERFLAAVENLRDAVAARIRSQIGGAEGEIAAALIAGVRAGIPEEVNEALRRTGLAHVLSISGLHMALVAATIMGSMRLLFACFQTFSARHPVRKYAAAAALLALSAYLFISGYQVAAQRSYVMIAIMLAALLFDHAALTMRNLALAALMVIVLSPHEVVGPSFQMSFAATMALVGAYGAWTGYRDTGGEANRHHGWVRRLFGTAMIYVVGLAATSLVAGLATAVFGAYHFQRVSPLSLAANLAAMPVVSVLVMPFAVLSLVAMPFGLDAIPLAVMGEGLRIMIAIADWFSLRSPLDAVGLVRPAAVLAFTLALVLATLLTTWLRLAALPCVLIGALLLLDPPRPTIFISEDGRQVAVRTAEGSLAVNRQRPNPFATENWLRSVPTQRIVKPTLPDPQAAIGAPTPNAAEQPDTQRFRCDGATCTAQPSAGERIVVAADAAAAKAACGAAKVVIVEDATTMVRCGGRAKPPTLVVNRRDLARSGAALLFRDVGGESYRLVQAIAWPHRPWHAHRRFARAARGLAPWQPERRDNQGKELSVPKASQPVDTEPDLP